MRSTTLVFPLSILAGFVAGYLWLTPAVSAENTFSQTTLDTSKINTPKIQGAPDFTALMASEGNKVVHISAMQKSIPQALSPRELFKKLIPPEDNTDEKNEPPPDLFKRKEKPQTGIGSGFFISSDGYLLTNAHVVNKADTITVKTSDRKEYKAKLVGIDTRTDIALLKVETGKPIIPIRTSEKPLQAGEWVAAIGSPFGFDNTITAGIVSAPSRYLPDDNYLPFIQTDVAINPGNSGGPLFNTFGHVVGMNTQIYTRSGGYMGMSFSIPIQDALRIADQLKNKGKLERSRIGVRIEALSHELAKALGIPFQDGVAVLYVEPRSPADVAGMKPGDIITSVQNQPIQSAQEITKHVADSQPNTRLLFHVVRGEQEKNITVTVQKADDAPSLPPLSESVPLPVVVTGPLGFVLEGNTIRALSSTAKNAGLQVGDTITQIQYTAISNQKDADSWLKKNKDFENVGVFYSRKGDAKFVILPRTEE